MATLDESPEGGTTGLSHQHSAAVEEAAEWLRTTPEHVQPVVPTLRARFGLTVAEACAAIRAARGSRW